MTEGSQFGYLQGKEFSLLHIVQTGYEANPACYKIGTGGSFHKVKAAGA
jgi:hypothetical protein